MKGKALALRYGNITVVYSLISGDLKSACSKMPVCSKHMQNLSRAHSLQLAFAAAFLEAAVVVLYLSLGMSVTGKVKTRPCSKLSGLLLNGSVYSPNTN